MILRTVAAAALTLAAQASAQTGHAARFLPSAPMLIVELDGPRKLEERFGGTNLAAMVASQELAAWTERVMAAAESEAAGMPPEARVMLEELMAVLEDYAGRMTMGVQIWPDSGDDGDPEVLVTFSMSPDGEVDLESVASLVRDEIGSQEGIEIRVESIADGSEAEVVSEGEFGCMLPRVVDGHLVLGIGKVDEWIAKLGEADSSDAGEARDGFRLTLTHELFELIPDLLAASDDFEAQMMADVLGPLLDMVEGVKKAVVSMRPADEFTVFEFDLSFDPSKRSLADLLAPPDNRPVALLDLAPRTAASVATSSVNLGAVFDLIVDIVEAAGEDFSQAETMFTEFTGARLREDLVDQLDGTVLMVEEAPADEFEDPVMTFALGVKDTSALEQTVESVLRKRGMHAGRKTEEYQGVQVRRLNLGFFELSWAFTDGALMLSVGGDDGRSIRTLIDASVDRKSGADPQPWPEKIAARLAHAGTGWHWLAVSDASGDVEATRDALETELAMAIDDVPWEVVEILLDLVEIMGEFDMLTSVTTTKFARGRIVSTQVL